MLYTRKYKQSKLIRKRSTKRKEREKRERRERREKKEKKLPPPTNFYGFALHHRKFETGRSASFDHLKKVINLLFLLSERIFLTEYIFFPISSYTHKRAFTLARITHTART